MGLCFWYYLDIARVTGAKLCGIIITKGGSLRSF